MVLTPLVFALIFGKLADFYLNTEILGYLFFLVLGFLGSGYGIYKLVVDNHL